MKKHILVLVATMLLVGCSPYVPKFENKQQQQFNDFLKRNVNISNNLENNIQKSEFYKQYEIDLFNYIDSTKLFINWRGMIKDIQTEKTGNLTAVEFKIYYEPEENREISFQCIHLVETESLKNDYIYNQVKNMRNNSIIYFDGLIRTKNTNEIYYEGGTYFEHLNISNPDYYFWIVDIGTTKRNDTLSKNLQNAVNYCYKITEPLKLQFLNKISKKESDNITEKLMPEFKNLESKLTESEKDYIHRLNTCLVNNFMYGGE
jgi:hypothetical protein